MDLVLKKSLMENFIFCTVKTFLFRCWWLHTTWSHTFFFIRVFFHGHWQFTGQQENGGDHLLSHSTTSNRSQTFRHLFATLHVRWLSYIFNRNACIYQTATRWNLLPYRINVWLIDVVMLIFVCLLVDLSLGFVTAIWQFALTIIPVLQANRLAKCANLTYAQLWMGYCH